MFDVIIVGSGPAGATAALYCHKAGLKTIVLDKATFPRDKVCGDALSGKAIRILRELDLLESLQNLEGAPIRRITFGSPNHKQFDLELKDSPNTNHIRQGFVIPRKIFDHFLFQEAQNVTEIRENFSVKDVLVENGNVTGIIGCQNDGSDEEIRANIVFGADGFNSILSRKLGLYNMDMEHTSVAIRCYYEGVKNLTDQIELHYVDEVNPGYFWIFPAGGNKANIGLGLSKDDVKKKKKNLANLLDDVTASPYFKERFADAKPLEKPVGWNLPLGSIRRPNHGDGFMLLGDAAGLVDPFTGEGIGNALVSAKFAAETAQKAKASNNFSSAVLQEYDTQLWDEIGSELRVSYKLQKLAKSRFLLNFVMNRATRNVKVRNIISGMLANEIPRKDLANPLFYLKILFA
ncbi:MAG: NAD(P)/FAD-dependent oxidoreductase [Candidatus Marinimicrobia bacterium]|jgi:geranylgeranyl reductase family protein|nr:NAD(P)/FAD-dependent oxidoreductase [Candidatus Neomarinimicrobiota bacterium]MBT3617472.1 NAD(P)/FAD-dependent oxidoreductase [Candidatus Neomarinimicrobiota bacterium]MBT3829412.1 NAD(P)/FAD-dependent oxidoreductase [Candidatus Neomarinimicrobiota bacterium]MBT3997006.1 NAD(P)/FAD-dependent oxidoreductase [Candidatus Neomarinimicrobiota bacterium]MBT4281132.1 NAD(P)/FAD-dependent oxidoreductase [Candidatus Neomarinimicrobiota bacterium]